MMYTQPGEGRFHIWHPPGCGGTGIYQDIKALDRRTYHPRHT